MYEIPRDGRHTLHTAHPHRRLADLWTPSSSLSSQPGASSGRCGHMSIRMPSNVRPPSAPSSSHSPPPSREPIAVDRCRHRWASTHRRPMRRASQQAAPPFYIVVRPTGGDASRCHGRGSRSCMSLSKILSFLRRVPPLSPASRLHKSLPTAGSLLAARQGKKRPEMGAIGAADSGSADTTLRKSPPVGMCETTPPGPLQCLVMASPVARPGFARRPGAC